MQLLTSLSQMDALPASDLKAHLQARHSSNQSLVHIDNAALVEA